MAIQKLGVNAFRCVSKRPAPLCNACQRAKITSPAPRRYAAFDAGVAAAAHDMYDLEPESSLKHPSTTTTPPLPEFDPLAPSRNRTKELPRGRYQYKPPRYYRGPLHPHQPPPPSDPASREFFPGPFTLPRLQQTYDSTLASDLMSLYYQHYPPGYMPPEKPPRLRSWDGTSPYHKGRPLRRPRGGPGKMVLLRKRITFRNIPKITGVTVHTFRSEALQDSAPLHVASMVLQAITGEKTTTHLSKTQVLRWRLKPGKQVALSANIKGEGMYHFVSKIVDVVLPRIKDWPGVRNSSGDKNGNITFGLTPEMVALFPEIEINFDSYPPRMIPGCHVTVQTSARTDRDARLLMTALGFPFYGKRAD